MVKASRNRVCTISITIEWCDANDSEVTEATSILKPSATARGKQNLRAKSQSNEYPNRPQRVLPQRTVLRLLPTDRIVLDALRARVPRNKRMTPAVSVRELAAECRISRRQMQICLRRLEAMKIIRRFTEGSGLGSQEGYKYQVSQGMFQRWMKSSRREDLVRT
jgi:hypothetical protein